MIPDPRQIGDGDAGGSIPDVQESGTGTGMIPDPRQIGDRIPIPVPGQIGDGDGDGDRGFPGAAPCLAPRTPPPGPTSPAPSAGSLRVPVGRAHFHAHTQALDRLLATQSRPPTVTVQV